MYFCIVGGLSSGQILGGIAMSEEYMCVHMCVLNKCEILLHKGYTNLPFHQQYIGVPIPLQPANKVYDYTFYFLPG